MTDPVYGEPRSSGVRSPGYEPLKRALDVAASAAGLIAFSWLMAIIAVAIRIESPGPALYRARRVGRDGVPFEMLKFRTMAVGADAISTTTALDDPRITRVGARLRNYKLDELPQLINVLRGEMSLVGPRPEVEEHTSEYTEEERLILTVKPGMTDFSSVHFVHLDEVLGAEDPHQVFLSRVRAEKNALRLKYVRERSFSVDLKILALTGAAVIRPRSKRG